MPTSKNKWTSRKFLLSFAAQLTALAVLLWPEHESVIVEASRSITALVVLALTALGYVAAEASIDRQAGERQRPGDEADDLLS